MGEGFKRQRNGEPPTPPVPKTYLYDEGNEYAALTGGWVIGYGGTPTKNADHIYLDTGFDTEGIRTNDKIDLTNINTLKVLVDITLVTGVSTYAILFAHLNTNDWGGAASVKATTSGATVIMELDVSSLSGLYYVQYGVSAGAGTSINSKMYKCWGE